MLKNKKLQSSIFMIIAIILVIVLIFLFANGKYEIFQSQDTRMKNQISQVVEDCIYDSAKQGAFLLGQQGGYIEIPKEISANPFAYTDFGFKIPNWDSSKSSFPTIKSMEEQLNQHIEDNAYSCITTNLKALDEAFEINADTNFTVESRINKENIAVESELTITYNEHNSEEIQSVSNYYVKLDELRLGNLYELALEVYQLENELYMFEHLVIDQIASANDYSDPKSMPTEGMSFSCSKRIWTMQTLKENLAHLNNNNFKYLQIDGTYSKDEIKKINLEEAPNRDADLQYFEKQYTYFLNNPQRSFQNYQVDVFMPSVEITDRTGIFKEYPYRTFEVTPNKGEVVESVDIELDAGIAKIPVPCVQIFHHQYTLDYDLIVKLTDKTEDDDLFTFQFPVRVEIYNNNPKVKSEVIPGNYDDDNQAEFCSNSSQLYPLMTIARDTDGNALNDVSISYKCIGLECNMGTTAKPKYQGFVRQYAEPELIANYPFCFGGKIIAEKEGYHTTKARVITDESLLRRETFMGDNLVELEMIPEKTFPITIESFLVKSRETGLGDRIYPENDGTAYVNIENQGYELESTAIWPNEEGMLDKLTLLDKEDVIYNLTVIYTDNNYQLKGILEIQNWTPQVHNGNTIQFIIPASDSVITEDSYLDFFDYMQTSSNSTDYQPKIY